MNHHSSWRNEKTPDIGQQARNVSEKIWLKLIQLEKKKKKKKKKKRKEKRELTTSGDLYIDPNPDDSSHCLLL
jgi:hypothetical protein